MDSKQTDSVHHYQKTESTVSSATVGFVDAVIYGVGDRVCD